MNSKIDLIKSFIQLESGIDLNHTTFNYDKNGGIEFSGYDDNGLVKFTLDKYQIETFNECQTIEEALEFYRDLEYFQTT